MRVKGGCLRRAALIVSAAAALLPAVSHAQSADAWQWRATIYGWFPGLKGETQFPSGASGPSLNVNADELVEDLKMAFMVPLLDHVFFEFNASLPGDWKLKGLTTKRIFRSALEGILPHDIVHRSKQGYSLPVKNLLRDRMRDYMVHLLNDSPLLREHCDMSFINRLIREYVSLTHNHNHVLWGLMNVAIWHQAFLTPGRIDP